MIQKFKISLIASFVMAACSVSAQPFSGEVATDISVTNADKFGIEIGSLGTSGPGSTITSTNLTGSSIEASVVPTESTTSKNVVGVLAWPNTHLRKLCKIRIFSNDPSES